MDDRQRGILLGAVAVLLALGLLAGGAVATGVATTNSETTVEATVVTSEHGNGTAVPDEVALHVESESDLSTAVGERVRAGLRDRGVNVTTTESLAEEYDAPLLVVAVDGEQFGSGFGARSATVDLTFYYSTYGDAAPWREYRETGSTSQDRPGALVTGELRYRDRTTGFSTRSWYRNRVTDALAEEVLDDYRGALAP